MSETRPAVSVNPWLDSQPVANTEPSPQVETSVEPVIWTPTQAGGQGGDWPTREASAGVWAFGAHGGAGTSLIAALCGFGDAGRVWPVGEGVSVVVVGRTHASGVEAVRRVCSAWARGVLPGVGLAGVMWVADSPKRPDKAVRGQIEVVSGGFPHAWHVGWCEQWRGVLVEDAQPDAGMRRVLSHLRKAGLRP